MDWIGKFPSGDIAETATTYTLVCGETETTYTTNRWYSGMHAQELYQKKRLSFGFFVLKLYIFKKKKICNKGRERSFIKICHFRGDDRENIYKINPP